MTPIDMYWLLKLDDIRASLTTFIFIFSLITSGAVILFISAKMDYRAPEQLSRLSRRLIIIFLPLLIIVIGLKLFLPSTTQMAAIIVVPKVVNNEKVQQIPEKILDLANQKLDSLIKPINKIKESTK